MTLKRKPTKKGAALITAVMLCAIFAAAIVGVGAFAIRQANISKTYNDGLVAYYAAESGVEEGLLRYRFDKNAQVPYTMRYLSNDPLKRTPRNAFRNFLDLPTTRTDTSDDGLLLGYGGNDLRPVYDLQVFYQQKYLGQDLESPFGIIDDADLRNDNYKNYPAYKIIKDESKSFYVPDDSGNLSLYWRWLKPCSFREKHALEVKVRLDILSAATVGNDTFTAVFNDPSCRVNNGLIPTTEGSVDYISDLKAEMGISGHKITEMTIHPVGQADKANVLFGFSQFDGIAQVSGLSTTVRSIGYFRGTTREIKAEIDRQSGTILDLFNYVIYKGGS